MGRRPCPLRRFAGGITRIGWVGGFRRDARHGPRRRRDVPCPGASGSRSRRGPKSSRFERQVFFLQAGIGALQLLGRRAGLVELTFQVTGVARARPRSCSWQVARSSGIGIGWLSHNDIDVIRRSIIRSSREYFPYAPFRPARAVALAAPRRGQVDAGEEQGEVGRGELEAGRTGDLTGAGRWDRASGRCRPQAACTRWPSRHGPR